MKIYLAPPTQVKIFLAPAGWFDFPLQADWILDTWRGFNHSKFLFERTTEVRATQEFSRNEYVDLSCQSHAALISKPVFPTKEPAACRRAGLLPSSPVAADVFVMTLPVLWAFTSNQVTAVIAPECPSCRWRLIIKQTVRVRRAHGVADGLICFFFFQE